jgi:hypothetical protein
MPRGSATVFASRVKFLGSARVSRAGDRVLAIADFSVKAVSAETP